MTRHRETQDASGKAALEAEAARIEDIDRLRRDLMRAALNHVAFDGWSWKAIEVAAEDCGVSRLAAEAAFPGGPAEVAELFSTEADRAMLRALEDQEETFESLGVRARIALAVRTRLEQNEAHKEAIRHALSFLAQPQHAALSLRLLYRTVDAMWMAAGDAATDLNFYSKRALLAGAYSATLLYWLEDRSEDHADTWAFLERRLNEIVRVGGRVGKNLSRIRRATSGLEGGVLSLTRRSGDLRMKR